MKDLRREKSPRQQRKEREARERVDEKEDALTMQAAKRWIGWERRGNRERYSIT